MVAYLYLKAFHVIAMVAWMAGMFYLPRLYVYHVDAEPGSELSETLKVMEHRLLRLIINPAMIATWVLGLILIFGFGVIDLANSGWLHAKIALVILLTVFHIVLSRWRRDFAADRNRRSARFYRIANEVPTVLLIFIVILVVVKPF
ncbi:MAG: protoporphyrinogen oxidase HemJ [Rhodomicrobiaceae bacterium]